MSQVSAFNGVLIGYNYSLYLPYHILGKIAMRRFRDVLPFLNLNLSRAAKVGSLSCIYHVSTGQPSQGFPQIFPCSATRSSHPSVPSVRITPQMSRINSLASTPFWLHFHRSWPTMNAIQVYRSCLHMLENIMAWKMRRADLSPPALSHRPGVCISTVVTVFGDRVANGS